MRGISSIQRLSVTQLNSEEPFVASVTLVVDAERTVYREEVLGKSEGGGEGTIYPGRILAAGTTALADSVKGVLARHNIGRNTVEIILPSTSDSPLGEVGSLGEGAKGEADSTGGGDRDRGAFLSANESRGGRNEAERRQLGAGGAWGGRGMSHGGHGHGHGQQCSGHGHSRAHAASVDLV